MNPLLPPCGVDGAPAMRELVMDLIPDVVANWIKPLLEAGMIEGWRNVIVAFPAMGRVPRKTRKG